MARTLYHQTDLEGAHAIKADGWCMRPGRASSLAGSGIYFAETPEDTHHKATRKGVLIRARVTMSRVHTISAGGDPHAEAAMRAAGADCVRIPRDRGVEWVVYSSHQVQVEALSSDGGHTWRGVPGGGAVDHSVPRDDDVAGGYGRAFVPVGMGMGLPFGGGGVGLAPMGGGGFVMLGGGAPLPMLPFMGGGGGGMIPLGMPFGGAVIMGAGLPLGGGAVGWY